MGIQRNSVLAVAAVAVLSVILAGCQVAGIGSPDATSTPAPVATETAAPPTPTTAASGQSSQTSTSGSTAQAKQWSSSPPMTIDVNKTYNIVMHTNMGDFTITLLPKEAPIAANNFLFLCQQHFYDNVIFHRIIAGFMIQGGDPTGTGTGGPGYSFTIETPKHYDYMPGIVAMANTGQPNSNGSQFFIMVANYSGGKLPKQYSIFGKVTAGMATVNKIAQVPVTASSSGEQSQPTETVKILSTTIHVG